jgi:hypothetical protein
VNSLPATKKKLSIFDQGVLMGKKLSTALIVFGVFLMLVGLSLLAAGLSQNQQDESIGGSGVLAFAFGALTCASGIYLKARAIQALGPIAANTKAQQKMRGGCDLCGTESPAVMCRVHQLHLCPACLGKHYDTRSCVYVPSTRRAAAAKAARA